MEKTAKFSQEVLEAMEEVMEITEGFTLQQSIPIILFKSILDLEVNPLYDYLVSNTYYEEGDFKDVFEEIITDIFGIKETDEIEEADKEKDETEIKKQQTAEEKVQVKNNFYYFEFPNTDKRIAYCKEFAKIISRAIQLSQIRNPSVVKVEDLLCAIAEHIPKDILVFLRKLSVDVKDFKKVFTAVKSSDDIIPAEMASFMRILNKDYKKGQECTILGRDKECKYLWRTLQKKTKRNAILIGEPGVGKSSIAKKITQDIVNGNCPEQFKDFLVISLNVTSIIAGTMYRGEAEERFTQVSQFLEEHNNVILFIDEIHLIMGAGACREDSMDFANALKPILAEDKARVIGATTSDEYEKYFTKDGATKRRFQTIEVKEPTCDKVYPMIKNKVKELSKYHHIRITPKMVEYIIFTSSCFHYETKNPDRTLDAIDLAMVAAKSKGKDSVDRQSVLDVYNVNFEMYNKMDYKVKKSTAYHEAGHYIVWRFSGHLKDIKATAVSIMPAECYLGVTVFDDLSESVVVERTNSYLIDSIAMDLGGRVAQKVYTKDISSGARSDLDSATKQAYEVVAKYGMRSSVGSNRIFISNEDYSMLSDKTIDNINDEIEKIIDEAYKRTEQIINENKAFLRVLANALIKKGMLSAKEIDVLYKKVYSKDKSKV